MQQVKSQRLQQSKAELQPKEKLEIVRKPSDILSQEFINYLRQQLECFHGDQLYNTWKTYTTDPYILDIIKNGLVLDLKEISLQNHFHAHSFAQQEYNIINLEIQNLHT